MTDHLDEAERTLNEDPGNYGSTTVLSAVRSIIAHLRASQPATETTDPDALGIYIVSFLRSSAAKDTRIAELERKLSRIYALVHAPENVAISLERVRGELEPTP